MPKLVWDKVGDRTYETGLDQGVLYLPDGSAVPWNGLTSVVESVDKESSPVYYDGMKINDLVVVGSFAATMKAVTYPDEFCELEGLGKLRKGIFLGDQKPIPFGLCYRTRIGNDLEGDAAGYKIHVVFNVTAIPHEKTYATSGDDPSLVEFEWDLTGVPEEVPGYLPTAHITINTQDIDPWLLEEIEAKLYGGGTAVASLIPMQDLVEMIGSWYRVKIIDNGDGTWTAIASRDGFIEFGENGLFTLLHVNARYLNDTTFVISDTFDGSDVPQILITNNGDGTWSATTDQDGLISIDENGVFTIFNATVVLSDSDSYTITDTTE